jgi:hypothetical protein
MNQQLDKSSMLSARQVAELLEYLNPDALEIEECWEDSGCHSNWEEYSMAARRSEYLDRRGLPNTDFDGQCPT